MTKLFLILLVTAFLAAVSCVNYDFQIILSDKKNDDYKGTLKLYLMNGDNSEDFLRLNQTSLRPGANYTTRNYEYQYFINQIRNVTFQWTLIPPFNPIYLVKPPSIYLESVKIVPAYVEDPYYRKLDTRTFCPQTKGAGIKHKERMVLFKC